ncbi:MAG: hypothetical protein ACYSWW_18105 [Planctomycetota bacterium]|jgi:hypothetical protein
MIDNLSLILNRRSDFSDECYGVIGRALAFATSFERNCEAFEGLVEMRKRSGFKDEQAIKDFCKENEKRKLVSRTKAIIDTCNEAADQLPEDLSKSLRSVNQIIDGRLQDAREARNEIAHDITKGIEYHTEDAERKSQIISDVEACVRRIAEADVWVYNLCQILTNEPIFQNAGSYSELAVKWVCAIEDQ